MEDRGWVTRRPNPNDRRGAILALTGAGRAIVRAADATVEMRLDQIVAAVASLTRTRKPRNANRLKVTLPWPTAHRTLSMRSHPYSTSLLISWSPSTNSLPCCSRTSPDSTRCTPTSSTASCLCVRNCSAPRLRPARFPQHGCPRTHARRRQSLHRCRQRPPLRRTSPGRAAHRRLTTGSSGTPARQSFSTNKLMQILPWRSRVSVAVIELSRLRQGLYGLRDWCRSPSCECANCQSEGQMPFPGKKRLHGRRTRQLFWACHGY